MQTNFYKACLTTSLFGGAGMYLRASSPALTAAAKRGSSSVARPSEILGNKDSPHVIKFEFCGGWGYRRQVMATIHKLEKHDWNSYDKTKTQPQMGGMFQYNLYKDKGITQRLEATLFVNNKDDQSEGGIKLHSKLDTNKFPEDKINDIISKIEDSIYKEWTKKEMVLKCFCEEVLRNSQNRCENLAINFFKNCQVWF